MKLLFKTSRKGGFTLLELLVVIAIIGLLAAILFSVFTRVRENARRASCQSNLRQLTLGMTQYVQDYDNRLPTLGGNGPNWVPPEGDGWSITLQPYLRSTQILQCPSELRKQNPLDPYGSTSSFTDYYMNSNLDYIPSTGADPVGISMTQVRCPNSTALFGDGLGNSPNYGGGSELLNDSTVALRSRHFEGNNYAFCDGHVKWFKRGVILTCINTPPPSLTCTPASAGPTGSNATFCY